jgi:hypothetical protein
MYKFKQYLNEGGNVKVSVGDKKFHAEPIKVTSKTRKKVANDVHEALSAMHDSFHKETGQHLFGKDKKALHTGSAFSGSTKHLMNVHHISDEEYAKHKPETGDADVLIPAEHKNALEHHLTPGKKFGKYTVVGTKKHGNELSAVMRHQNGEHHQFDFEASHYHKDEPSEGDQFIHNSHWADTKAGIKGVHHKLLLNAIGGATHKFSNTHGLRSRTDEHDEGTKDPKEISKKLFGSKADHTKVHSFIGLTDLIKKHIHPSRHQEIYNKFKEGINKQSKIGNNAALEHLKNHLDVHDTVREAKETETHHTTVVPLTGFSPISHMGHAHDLGSTVKKLPGTKHIGISSKSDVYSPEERAHILHKQWNQKDLHAHVVKSAGETIRAAHDSLPAHGKKVLHLVVGHDRKDMAEGLKKSLEAGKIKEMHGKHFDEIHIHHPEDTERSHGMSGTNMRTAALNGHLNTFHKHLGSMFSKEEAKKHMERIKSALQKGKLAVKRK